MTAFVRDQWYIAAYQREVGRELLGRTVLGEPILLYRTEGGRADLPPAAFSLAWPRSRGL